MILHTIFKIPCTYITKTTSATDFSFVLLHNCVQLELDCENNDKFQYYDNTNSASRFSKNQTCYSLIITLFLNTVTFELPFFLTWKTHAQILHAKSLQPTSRFSFIPSSWKWQYAEVEGVWRIAQIVSMFKIIQKHT